MFPFSNPRDFLSSKKLLKKKEEWRWWQKKLDYPSCTHPHEWSFFYHAKARHDRQLVAPEGVFLSIATFFFFKAFGIGIGFDLFEREREKKVYPFYIFFDLITFTLKGFSGRTSNWWWLLYTPGQHTLTHPTHTLFLQPIRFLSLRLVNKSKNIFLFLNLARWRSPKTEKFSGIIKIISDEADLFCVCASTHFRKREEEKERKDSIVFCVVFQAETGQDIGRIVCDAHAGGLMAIWWWWKDFSGNNFVFL